VDRGGRRVVDLRDVLAFDGATRWSTARDAAAGYRLDGVLHFCAGAHEQKAKNLEVDAWCVLRAQTSCDLGSASSSKALPLA
jgi:hypothetical protein